MADEAGARLSDRMIELAYRRIWTVGQWLRNRTKNAGLLGRLEPALLKIGPWLVPAPKSEVLVRLPFGMQMAVPPGYPAGRSYLSGLYEPEVTHLFESLVRDGMTVVDAGANVGYYTLLSSFLVGATGQVHAFEPDPLNYSYLRRNVHANACANTRSIQEAVTSTAGAGRFVRDSYGSEGFLTGQSESPAAINVATVSLDAYFEAQGWPNVHLVKIDIEGSEALALEGMRELSRRNDDLRLIMELNFPAMSRSGHTSESIATLLRDQNFTFGYIIEAGLRPFSVAQGLPASGATYNVLLQRQKLVSN